jgi:hypothetical protein
VLYRKQTENHEIVMTGHFGVGVRRLEDSDHTARPTFRSSSRSKRSIGDVNVMTYTPKA